MPGGVPDKSRAKNSEIQGPICVDGNVVTVVVVVVDMLRYDTNMAKKTGDI